MHFNLTSSLNKILKSTFIKVYFMILAAYDFNKTVARS